MTEPPPENRGFTGSEADEAEPLEQATPTPLHGRDPTIKTTLPDPRDQASCHNDLILVEVVRKLVITDVAAIPPLGSPVEEVTPPLRPSQEGLGPSDAAAPDTTSIPFFGSGQLKGNGSGNWRLT